MEGAKAEPKRWLLAGLLFALALGLRLAGIGHMLPHCPEPDVVYGVQLRGETMALERYEHLTSYPLLVPELAKLGRKLFPARKPPRTLDEALRAAAAPIRDCRIVVAILASLAAPATFLCAARFLRTGPAFLAGLLAATNVLGMCYSTQARPHAALGGLVALTLASLIALRERPTWRSHLLAGAALAASIGVLLSALSLLLPFAAAFLLRAGPRKRSDWLKPLVSLAMCIPVAALGFALPSARGPLEQSVQPDRAVFWWGGHIVELEHFRGGGFGSFFWTLWSYDAGLLALLALGAIVGLVALRRRVTGAWPRSERGKSAAVLAAFAVPYILVFGLYDGTYPRFMLPLVPIACVLGAWSALALARALRGLGRPIALALPALLVALPCTVALKLAWLRTRPDTIELAAAALRTMAQPEQDRIWVGPSLELPLLSTPEALERNRAELEKVGSPEREFWTRYQLEHPTDLPGEPRFDTTLVPVWGRIQGGRYTAPTPEELAQATSALVVAGRLDPGRDMHPHHALRAALRERAPPVARFKAVPWGEEGRGLAYDRDPRNHPPYWLDVLRAEHVGPYLEISRLEPAPPNAGAARQGD
jgi:hypothetical protein